LRSAWAKIRKRRGRNLYSLRPSPRRLLRDEGETATARLPRLHGEAARQRALILVAGAREFCSASSSCHLSRGANYTEPVSHTSLRLPQRSADGFQSRPHRQRGRPPDLLHDDFATICPLEERYPPIVLRRHGAASSCASIRSPHQYPTEDGARREVRIYFAPPNIPAARTSARVYASLDFVRLVCARARPVTGAVGIRTFRPVAS
jgi:hypothetical protein